MAVAKKTTEKVASSSGAVSSSSKVVEPSSRTEKIRKSTSSNHKIISMDERFRLIAESAYFKAQSRGFAGGSPESDWFDAEREVDEELQAGGVIVNSTSSAA